MPDGYKTEGDYTQIVGRLFPGQEAVFEGNQNPQKALGDVDKDLTRDSFWADFTGSKINDLRPTLSKNPISTNYLQGNYTGEVFAGQIFQSCVNKKEADVMKDPDPVKAMKAFETFRSNVQNVSFTYWDEKGVPCGVSFVGTEDSWTLVLISNVTGKPENRQVTVLCSEDVFNAHKERPKAFAKATKDVKVEWVSKATARLTTAKATGDVKRIAQATKELNKATNELGEASKELEKAEKAVKQVEAGIKKGHISKTNQKEIQKAVMKISEPSGQLKPLLAGIINPNGKANLQNVEELKKRTVNISKETLQAISPQPAVAPETKTSAAQKEAEIKETKSSSPPARPVVVPQTEAREIKKSASGIPLQRGESKGESKKIKSAVQETKPDAPSVGKRISSFFRNLRRGSLSSASVSRSSTSSQEMGLLSRPPSSPALLFGPEIPRLSQSSSPSGSFTESQAKEAPKSVVKQVSENKAGVDSREKAMEAFGEASASIRNRSQVVTETPSITTNSSSLTH